jgi:beta-phosphoglucomutase family hydrolase
VLGLPDGITACLFDLDGVLTKTAVVHERAWKVMFDEFLGDRKRGVREAAAPRWLPFEESDYTEYVDGKPREDGIRDFLASRDIKISESELHTLSERKNALVLKLIHDEGVEAYPGSVEYLKAARDAGLRRAVVSSSHNCEDVLRVAGIAEYLEARVDGNVIDQLGLRGKPAPDSFLEGARRLGVRPDQAAVFEDALAGVQAGHDGKFGVVVGVNRGDHRDILLRHGADIVVDDLAELLER